MNPSVGMYPCSFHWENCVMYILPWIEYSLNNILLFIHVYSLIKRNETNGKKKKSSKCSA